MNKFRAITSAIFSMNAGIYAGMLFMSNIHNPGVKFIIPMIIFCLIVTVFYISLIKDQK